MVSALTKYASLMALPLTALMDIRHKRWRSLMIGALTCVLALIVLAGPYLQDMAIVGWPKMAQNAVMAQHSIHSALGRVVFYAGRWVPALRGWDDTTRQALRIVTLLAFVGLYGWALRRFWRELACLPSAVLSSQRLAYWIMLLLTAFLALASAKFHAWYLGMIFPLYLITPVQNGLWDWPRRFGLMLAAFQLLSFTSLNNIHILNFLLLTATPLILSYRAARAEQRPRPQTTRLRYNRVRALRETSEAPSGPFIAVVWRFCPSCGFVDVGVVAPVDISFREFLPQRRRSNCDHHCGCFGLGRAGLYRVNPLSQ